MLLTIIAAIYLAGSFFFTAYFTLAGFPVLVSWWESLKWPVLLIERWSN